MKDLISFLLRPLMNERGEAGIDDDDPGDEIELDEDDVQIGIDDPDESEDQTTEDEDEGEEEEEEEDDETEKRKAELEKIKEEAQYWKEQKEKNRSLYFAEKNRKGKKAEDDDTGDVEFSDEQLLGMLEAHKEDNVVLLQIMKQVGKQAAKKGEKNAINAAEMASQKKQLDSYLSENWPEINDESSEIYGDVQKAKELLHLEDHPMADFLAAGSVVFMNMKEMIKQAEERGKKANLKDASDNNRKKSIKNKKLSPKGKENTATVQLSSSAQETAKMLGFNKDKRKLAIYKKMIAAGKKKQPVSTEV